jgi:hypothetical protein
MLMPMLPVVLVMPMIMIAIAGVMIMMKRLIGAPVADAEPARLAVRLAVAQAEHRARASS